MTSSLGQGSHTVLVAHSGVVILNSVNQDPWAFSHEGRGGDMVHMPPPNEGSSPSRRGKLGSHLTRTEPWAMC